MSKNLIPKVAELLGLQIGEEFTLREIGTDKIGKYKFDETGLIQGCVHYPVVLARLLSGEVELIKQPLLTPAERTILENLPKEYEWIARDKTEKLYIYEDKPVKGKYTLWFAASGTLSDFPVKKDLLKFIQWSNAEPYNIKELLEGK